MSIDRRFEETEERLQGDLDSHRSGLIELVQERNDEILQLVDDEVARFKTVDTERAAIAQLLYDAARRFEGSGE